MDGPAPERSTAQVIEDTEAWFLQRGIPHFIEDYSAGEDVFTRAAPVLGLVFLFELAGATNLEWAWWQNTLAILAAAVMLMGAWALVNRAAGLPMLRRPDRVGPLELVSFVLAPALLPLLFGGQFGAAALTALGNLALLGLVYLVTSYGLIPMTRWAFSQMFQQVSAVAGLLGRALPLLLLFSITLFINTEMWQMSAALDAPLLAITVGLFVVLGMMFLLSRLPGEMRQLGSEVGHSGVIDACVGTPLEGVATDHGQVELPPLSRRQRGNVLLVLLFSQAVQVVLITIVMGLFFLVLGLVTIREPVIATWVGDLGSTQRLLTQTFGGHEIVLTRALVNVSVFLAVFSGFYFTVYAVIDPTYREQFFDGIVGQVRQAMGVRAVYLDARNGLIDPRRPVR